jgi:hypothetical protein
MVSMAVGRISKNNARFNKYLNNLLLVDAVMSAEENMQLMKTLDDSWNSKGIQLVIVILRTS